MEGGCAAHLVLGERVADEPHPLHELRHRQPPVVVGVDRRKLVLHRHKVRHVLQEGAELALRHAAVLVPVRTGKGGPHGAGVRQLGPEHRDRLLHLRQAQRAVARTIDLPEQA